MPEIILHQYVNSPFSEKIRKIFAHKKISWRSVEQPVIMPKPKLVPLTGGYRRIPVMQIGADVWSDTAIIVRKIDELYPEPTIYPDGLSAAAETMNQWADRRMFWSTMPVIFEKLAVVVPKGFVEDRAKMMQGANFGNRRSAPDARNQLRGFLDILDRQLADSSVPARRLVQPGRCRVLSLRSGSCAPSPTRSALRNDLHQPHALVRANRRDGRTATCGRWIPTKRLKIATESTPATAGEYRRPRSEQLKAGTRIRHSGRLRFRPGDRTVVVSTIHEIAIQREDPELGKIVNHFPKIGFRIAAA